MPLANNSRHRATHHLLYRASLRIIIKLRLIHLDDLVPIQAEAIKRILGFDRAISLII